VGSREGAVPRDDVHAYLRNDADAAVYGDRHVTATADAERPARLLRCYSVWTEGGARREKWSVGFAYQSIFAHKAGATNERKLRPARAKCVEVEQAGKHDVSISVLDSHLLY
jgi:hypothetical protein